jgi:hypothetical protein
MRITVSIPELDYNWYKKHIGKPVENMRVGEVKPIATVIVGVYQLHLNFVQGETCSVFTANIQTGKGSYNWLTCVDIPLSFYLGGIDIRLDIVKD